MVDCGFQNIAGAFHCANRGSYGLGQLSFLLILFKRLNDFLNDLFCVFSYKILSRLYLNYLTGVFSKRLPPWQAMML